MRQVIFAVALAAASFASAPASARLDLASLKCGDPNIAPGERVTYCKLQLAQAGSGEADDVGASIALADVERLAGNSADAEAILNAKLVRFPKSLLLLMERSIVLAEENKYDLAIVDADKAVELRGDYVTWGNRCWMRAVAGKELDAAIEDCNKALAEHSDAVSTDSLAFVYYRQGNLKAALDRYTAALEIFSRQWPSLYMRGIVKLQTGDTAGGKDDIDTAIRHAPYVADEFAGYGVKP